MQDALPSKCIYGNVSMAYAHIPKLILKLLPPRLREAHSRHPHPPPADAPKQKSCMKCPPSGSFFQVFTGSRHRCPHQGSPPGSQQERNRGVTAGFPGILSRLMHGR